MINIKENEKLNVLNHSCAHLLAHAVKHLYKDAKFWVGPVIESGFYYDIDLGDKVLTEDDLPQIEKEMKKISKSDKLIKRIELTKEEALDMFKDDPYKIDLIDRMDEYISPDVLRQNNAVLFDVKDGKARVCFADTANRKAIDTIRLLLLNRGLVMEKYMMKLSK